MANIPLISSAIGAGLGLGTSIWGGIKAGQANRKMRELEKNRPTYSRPDEIKQYLEMAKTGARGTMPGQTQMEQNVQQSTQSAVSALQESGGLDAGAIQKLYQSEVGAYNNLAMQQGQYYQSQSDRLAQAFQQSAKYADQEWEYNVNTPWQRQYNRAIGKYESGQQMINQGLSNIVGSASNYARMNMATDSPYNTGYNQYASSYSQPQGVTSISPLDLGQSSQIDTSTLRSIPR